MSKAAYFATGCFWGAERRFWQLEGVIQTSVGYMGGNKSDPTYKEVCAGNTNHAEMVEVIYDSSIIYQKELSDNGIGKIVTEILPASGVTYWLAEEYHQKYLVKNPNGYDCHSSTGVAYPLINSGANE